MKWRKQVQYRENFAWEKGNLSLDNILGNINCEKNTGIAIQSHKHFSQVIGMERSREVFANATNCFH